MADSKIRLNFFIETDQKERLERLSDGRPIALLIRRAIDAYLEVEEAKLRKKK